MNADRHSQPMCNAMKLAGITSPSDAFSKMRLFWAFRAYETHHADRVAIQFRADDAPQLVEVDAIRFSAFLKVHHRHHEIRAALGRKLEQQRSKIHP